jgi:hypothetical protein
MTPQQAKWLKDHPEFEVVMVQGVNPGVGGSSIDGCINRGSDNHDEAGALHPTGIFVPYEKVVPPAILVGKRKTAPEAPGGRFGGGR